MNKPTDASAAQTRRGILGWGGAGLLAALAGWLGWRKSLPPEAAPPMQSAAVADAAGKPVPAESQQEAQEPAQPQPPAPMSRESFLPHLQSEFRLDAGGLAGVSCKLTDVSEAQTQHGKGGVTYTAFALLFATPGKTEIESAIHQLAHADLGEMSLFLSPVGRSKQRTYLEAVFSQRV